MIVVAAAVVAIIGMDTVVFGEVPILHAFASVGAFLINWMRREMLAAIFFFYVHPLLFFIAPTAVLCLLLIARYETRVKNIKKKIMKKIQERSVDAHQFILFHK